MYPDETLSSDDAVLSLLSSSRRYIWCDLTYNCYNYYFARKSSYYYGVKIGISGPLAKSQQAENNHEI
jgi:hypothetical protein